MVVAGRRRRRAGRAVGRVVEEVQAIKWRLLRRKLLRSAARAAIRKRRARAWRSARATRKEWEAIREGLVRDLRDALESKLRNKMDASWNAQELRQRSLGESIRELDYLLRGPTSRVLIRNSNGTHHL